MSNPPKKILGFIELDNINYPFSYDEPFLYLIPPSHNEWGKKKKILLSELEKLVDNQPNDKWAESRLFRGITSKETHVIFKTKATIKNDNGFESVEVEDIYEYDPSYDKEGLVHGLAINSDELEYFHNITNRFVRGLSAYHNELTPYEHYSATASNSVTHIGSFSKDSIKMDFELEIYPVYNFDQVSGGKREKKTMLRILFDKPIEFQTCLSVLRYVKQFIKFICYRSNINLRSVTTLRREEEGNLLGLGKIFTLFPNDQETNPNKKTRIISYDLIHEQTVYLLEASARNEIVFSHFCKNIDSQRTYNPARAILIFAAFEKEYSHFFKDDTIRSHTYYTLKKQAIRSLSDIGATLSAKNRKDIDRFISIINNSDDSLDARIKKVLKKYLSVINPFLTYFYGSEREYLLDEIAERVRKIRNAYAHGDFGIDLLPVHLSDLKVLEILLYVMRFDALALDQHSIRQAIQQVFGINPN